MRSEMVDKRQMAEAFVRNFFRRFWGNDEAYIERVAASDFVMIAAQDDQYCLDRDQALALYRDLMRSVSDIAIIDEDYTTVMTKGEVTVVSGSFYGVSNPDSGVAFSARQRVTAVLRDAPGDTFQVVHLHISNPLSISRKGEFYPVNFSHEAYRYVRMLSSQHSDRASIEVREIGGAMHVLRIFDVVYLEADRQYTMIHCLSKTVRSRQGIGVLSKRFPANRFFEVRRGCIVNILHVLSWDAAKVVLTGDIEIPIPVRRSSEVRERIEELRKAMSGSSWDLQGVDGDHRDLTSA